MYIGTGLMIRDGRGVIFWSGGKFMGNTFRDCLLITTVCGVVRSFISRECFDGGSDNICGPITFWVLVPSQLKCHDTLVI